MNQSTPDSLLTDETVRHVAHLARLALTEKEVIVAKTDLTSIFKHIHKLNAIDTTKVDPLDHPTELTDHTREDETGKTLSQNQVLENAPSVKEVYFEVPKVLGDSE